MTRVERRICQTCRWGWFLVDEDEIDKAEDLGFGECRRHAPCPVPTDFRGTFRWPSVKPEDGCGEWKTRYISDNE